MLLRLRSLLVRVVVMVLSVAVLVYVIGPDCTRQTDRPCTYTKDSHESHASTQINTDQEQPDQIRMKLVIIGGNAKREPAVTTPTHTPLAGASRYTNV